MLLSNYSIILLARPRQIFVNVILFIVMSMAATVLCCEPGGILVTFDTTGWRLDTNIQLEERLYCALYTTIVPFIEISTNNISTYFVKHNPYFSILFNDSYKQNKVSSSTIFSLFSLSYENSFIVVCEANQKVLMLSIC